MPGIFAYLALAAWIPFSVVAFAVWRPSKAAVVVMLGGMLLLPEGVYFDAPLIPPLGKHEVSATCALLGLLLRAPRQLHAARVGRGLDVLLLLLVPAAVVTVLNNRHSLTFGATLLPAMQTRDVIAFAVRSLVTLGFPFLVGRLCLQSSRDARMLARVVLGLGLLYSLLILFETRFSPNLHRWIFGYHARPDFSQTIRWGGYRPTVFMEHGLAVALFSLVVALFAASDGRIGKRRFGLPAWWSTLYVVLILVACKSAGTLILGLVALPAVLWLTPRRQIGLAVLLATICVAYPGAKLAGVLPDQKIVSITQSLLGTDRASSLAMRFANENLIIEHARKRLWFGWGAYGRNRLYDENGNNAVVTDGEWIILLGTGGVVQLACVFSLLLLPVFMARRALRRVRDPEDRLLLAGLALVTVCSTFDLLPNGMFNYAQLFFAGALARLVRELKRKSKDGEWQEVALPEATAWPLPVTRSANTEQTRG